MTNGPSQELDGTKGWIVKLSYGLKPAKVSRLYESRGHGVCVVYQKLGSEERRREEKASKNLTRLKV